MSKRKALEISDKQKIDIMKRNRKISDRAFGKKSCDMYKEEFVDKIRPLCGYSINTYKDDILRSWERVYKTIKKYKGDSNDNI